MSVASTRNDAAPAVVVDLVDLRAALAAVRPHVYAGKDPIPTLERIRVLVDAVNVTLVVSDGLTGAAALVSLLSVGSSGVAPDPFDLSPTDAAEILAVFPAPAKDSSTEIRLEVGSAALTVTDCGGLFPGKQLVLPRLPVADTYPDVLGWLSRTLRDAVDGAHPTDGLGVVADGRRLAALRAAATAYGEPLLLRTCGQQRASLLVLCGDSFIAVLSAVQVDDVQAGQHADWQAAWARRLPDPATATAPPDGFAALAAAPPAVDLDTERSTRRPPRGER